MSVAGFQEAYDASVPCMFVGESLTVQVQIAAIPALAALKINAWLDRPDQRRRDVRDLAFILKNYLRAGLADRLLDGIQSGYYPDELGTDPELAGAFLLGSDMGALLRGEASARLRATLNREVDSTSRCPLAHELQKDFHGSFTRARTVLQYLLQGVIAGGTQAA